MNNTDVFRFWTTPVMRKFVTLATRLAWLICLLWSGVLVLRADTHYVSLQGTNNSPYLNWADAATQIQWAVNAAAVNDTVLVSNGTYYLTNQVEISNHITVRAFTEQGHGTNDTIVDGNNYVGKLMTNRCFFISNGTLDSLTIQNGVVTNRGAGVYFVANSQTGNLYNCLIQLNVATNSDGGGFHIGAGVNGFFTNCTFYSNRAYCLDYGGGGGGRASYSNIKIYNCRFRGNRSEYYGGGLLLDYVTAASVVSNCLFNENYRSGIKGSGGFTINNCVISNNTCPVGDNCGLFGDVGTYYIYDSVIVDNKQLGGSIWAASVIYFSPTVVMSNCVVMGNVCQGNNSSAGISASFTANSRIVNCIFACNSGTKACISSRDYSTNCTVRNCLIYNNTNTAVDVGGGAVYWAGTNVGQAGIFNCTIASNVSVINGGGLYVGPGSNNVKNCIIYGNRTTGAGDTNDDVFFGTAEATNCFWNNCTPNMITNPAVGQGNLQANPLFVAPVNNNYRLSANSPCINAGTNQDWMTNGIDLDGLTRIRYGTVDMGAYELIYPGTMYIFH